MVKILKHSVIRPITRKDRNGEVEGRLESQVLRWEFRRRQRIGERGEVCTDCFRWPVLQSDWFFSNDTGLTLDWKSR